MILNVKTILDKGFVIPNNAGKPAQVGYDLTIKEINKIIGGEIGKDTSNISPYQVVHKDAYLKDGIANGWYLMSGVYSLTFDQGIKLDNKHTAFIRHRSSILRCGSLITSGVFDPGFECEEIGATLFVYMPISIEDGARLAQIIVMENQPAEKYDGDYQGDKDKK